MYRPGAFVEDDPARLAALIRMSPLASLVVHTRGRLLAAHAPVLAEQAPDGSITALVGHLARANPFWSELEDGAEVLAIFTGPDAYVSPSVYPSKQEHGEVVPTWNYARIEARGRITVEADPAKVRPYFESLTEAHEKDRAEPWSVGDAPDRYIEKLQHALVGIRIAVEDIRGALKLSQNKTDPDFAGVRDALAASSSLSDQATSALMALTARLD
ncbi:FMN-binding negative transcriptional regulator [Brevundimonas sp.]|uniref:FMN-binding negative transcriptional regulator n=1 Tax=Brevundimonas sp. TaxID=1871086 RepID=UPI00391B1D6A